jgi:hypothetical protein
MRDDAGGEWIGRGFMRMRDALRLGGEGRVECGLVHVRGNAGEGGLSRQILDDARMRQETVKT